MARGALGAAGRVRYAVLILATALAACEAGNDGPPEIVLDRTTCSHCRMLVSEAAFAAAYRYPGAEPRVFDDIGCLLSELRSEQRPEPPRIWVHDFESGEWIDAAKAAFVVGSDIETPMGGGIVAVADRARASQMASERGGRSLESVAELTRERSENEER